MEELPFQDEEFDLIWSEGAIYNIGFERGLNEWRKFLKKRDIFLLLHLFCLKIVGQSIFMFHLLLHKKHF